MFLFAKINPREKRENCSIRENKSSRNTEKCDSRKLIHAKICHRENFSARKFVHLRYIIQWDTYMCGVGSFVTIDCALHAELLVMKLTYCSAAPTLIDLVLSYRTRLLMCGKVPMFSNFSGESTEAQSFCD